jgi:UDP:flavonoid glycosyltransferase YjiC (YdhE family)
LLDAPRILFIPVSGAFGMGEYARSLSIAHSVRRQWPKADIHFLLSRQAPYAAAAPFPATLLDSSPTFHTAAVRAWIQKFQPHVVIFDNAGRTAQLRAAARAGARIIFISSRSRQRRKAFRWRWMRLLDEHWFAYPQFIAGGLNFLERIKLAALGKPVVRYLDVILSRAASNEDSVRARAGLQSDAYVLLVPGGGTGHPRAADAAAIFLSAANTLANTGISTVFVGPGGAGTPGAPGKLFSFDSLPQSELAELLGGAKLVITNGGSTLLQAIACGRACVAVPIAQDQSQRIQRCVEAGVAKQAKLDSSSIARVAEELLRDEAARAALARRATDLGLADGVEVALRALTGLLETA